MGMWRIATGSTLGNAMRGKLVALSATVLSGVGLVGGMVAGCRSTDRVRTVRSAAPDVPAPAGKAPAESAQPGAAVRTLTTNSPSQAKDPVGTSGPVAAVPKPLPQEGTPRLRSERAGFVVVVREDCVGGAPTYDLTLHFHGLANVVERQWAKAQVDGVLAVANAGAWSRDYKRAYEHAGVLDELLTQVEEQLREVCPELRAKPQRLALSGWSAGYTVVRAVLQDEGPTRIDAVLLADGIHARLSSARPGGTRSEHSRSPEPGDVAAFVEFGRLAARGDRLMSITHSDIRTPNYASTTETTHYLLQQLNLERQSLGASTAEGQRSLVEAGGFRLRGYAGLTAKDHAWHLHHLGETTLLDLRHFWNDHRDSPARLPPADE